MWIIALIWEGEELLEMKSHAPQKNKCELLISERWFQGLLLFIFYRLFKYQIWYKISENYSITSDECHEPQVEY